MVSEPVTKLPHALDRGHHRAPSIPDLLIAATAEQGKLIVLHADEDFEIISEITGQPVERLRF
ncbi:PIN domain-containing protein [Nocardia sp. 004]|uniref:PIN domain-containing protein n=1 Tax=Nocardia sp. 004 TaxID=3385978 RepID=UPI0039A1AB2A